MADKAVTVGTSATLQGFSVDGADVATVPDSNALGGIPVMHRVTVLNAATGDVDTVVQHKIGIVDVWLIKQGGAGGAGDTVQVTDGDNQAITEAMSINVADKAIVRATTIDDASAVILANGVLRIKRVKASAANVKCTVVVEALKL